MYLTSDPVVLSTTVLTTVAAGVLLWRRRASGRAFGASMPVVFTGAAVTLMLLAHCAEIGYRLAGGTLDGMPPLRYDFRAYSLLLLGAVLIGFGVRAFLAAAGIARGEPAARASAFRAVLGVLAVSAPIIPIHPFFGPIGTALAVIGLIGVAIAPASPAADRTHAAADREPAAVGG